MAGTSNTSATITQAVSFKIAYGTDKRRFNAPSAQLSKPGSYAVLRQQLLELFSLSKNPAASPLGEDFVFELRYKDAEEDWCTVSSDAELVEAVNHSLTFDDKVSMQIFVVPKPQAASTALATPAAGKPTAHQLEVCKQITQRIKSGILPRRPPPGPIWNTNKAGMKLPPVITRKPASPTSSAGASSSDKDEWCVVDNDDDHHHQHRDSKQLQKTVQGAAKALELHSSLQGKFTNTINFFINGRGQQLTNPSPNMKLAEYLRDVAALTGTKIGCGEGGCGACTVVLSHKNNTGTVVTMSVNSCLHPVCSLDGVSIITTEGIGSERSGFHAIQSTLASNDGSQCGYCSPGMVMEMYGLLANNAKPDLQTIEDNFDGNICRCTGYRSILTAMHSFASSESKGKAVQVVGAQVCKKNTCADVEDLFCENKQKSESKGCCSKDKAHDHSEHVRGAAPMTGARISAGKLVKLVENSNFDPKVDLLPFPEELKAYQRRASYHVTADALWFTPASLADVFTLLSTYSDSVVKLVAGNSSIGVEKYYPFNPNFDNPSVLINVMYLPELSTVTVGASGITFGASVTLSTILNTLIANQTAGGCYFDALVRHIKNIANTQVRNVASWAGNLMLHKSHQAFPSDMVTILTAVGATVSVMQQNGSPQPMTVPAFIANNFPNTVILYSLVIPFAPPVTVTAPFFDTFKVADRHQNAHALINAGFNFTLDPAYSVVISASLVFGGVGVGLTSCPLTAQYLTGKAVNAATLAGALPLLQQECTPPADPTNVNYVLSPAAYRQSLCLTLFYKFFLEICAKQTTPLPARLASAIIKYQRPVSSGTEVYTPYAPEAPIGAPIHKLSAVLQASGEAIYTDDMPRAQSGLQGAFVLSTVPNGVITSIDATAALTMPGVVAFITASDVNAIGGSNNCGDFPGDEEIFASINITHVGQTIGLLVADTRHTAEEAAKLVVVQYGPANPPQTPIYTIKDAIAANSFLTDNQYVQHMPQIAAGSLPTGFAASDQIYQGELYTGEQAHFYMETQAANVIPDENDVLNVFCSSQGPQSVRSALAVALNYPANKLIVTTKRAGGGFGGKLSRDIPVACAAAVASVRLGRPVRVQTNRNTDLSNVGKRHDHYANYKIGVKNDGTIMALQVQLYSNGGSSYDATLGCMDMCQLWADNVYYMPNYLSQGYCVRTNLPANTAMRAPGALNSIYFIESMIERVATELKLDPVVVRQKNFYQTGQNQTTPYGQPVGTVQIQNIWQQLSTNCNYAARVTAVQTFNSQNRWRKRGIRITPVKYAIGVSSYQASVLLNVMVEDGTVQVCHGGVEIGQGINTKVAQVIAYELGIDIKLINITTTSTEKIPNFTNTGGSGTSETTCQAAVIACQQLNAVLAPIKQAHPTANWPTLCGLAVGAGLCLSSVGHFALTSEAGGFPFTYFVYAAACSEVELDVLTGEIQIVQTDIVYDSGYSLNYALDCGQVEGAFVQGLGFFFTEHVVVSNGRMVNNGTWDYKPPCSKDIPQKFNVSFLVNTPNAAPNAVLSSKASGEPPYMLAASAFFAAKDAIYAARSDAGITGYFDLPTPATIDQIQLASGVTAAQLTLTGSSAAPAGAVAAPSVNGRRK